MRLVASPALAEAGVLSDQHAWRVDVPAGTFVTVTAVDANGNLFYLRANRTLGGLWLPGPAASLPLDAPGAWRVEVDPLAGARVDIRVTFRGHVADGDGIAAPFTLTELEAERGCVTAGVCLP